MVLSWHFPQAGHLIAGLWVLSWFLPRLAFSKELVGAKQRKLILTQVLLDLMPLKPSAPLTMLGSCLSSHIVCDPQWPSLSALHKVQWDPYRTIPLPVYFRGSGCPWAASCGGLSRVPPQLWSTAIQSWGRCLAAPIFGYKCQGRAAWWPVVQLEDWACPITQDIMKPVI